MAGQSGPSFAVLLKYHRQAEGLSQDGLAKAAKIGTRTIINLELGHASKPQADTVRRLAEALKLTGPARQKFEAAARNQRWDRAAPAAPAGDDDTTLAGRLRGDPQAWLTYVVSTLDTAGVASARTAVAEWNDYGTAEAAWLAWADRLITLTGEGRMFPPTPRPMPTADEGPFLNRDRQAAALGGFADRVRRGRGGLALVLGEAGIGKSLLLVNVLAERTSSTRVEWVRLDRGEAGYQGWRRLLAPLWIALRRTELAPARLIPHASTLDDVLLVGRDDEKARWPLPGASAAAVAAMLMHLAARQPLTLVIDDAHRGGDSSDRLLLEVARRVNASRVGLIAALRPGELEDDSPLRAYSDRADGRAAPDLVVPIRVPPLGRTATADLIREQTGVEPPPGIVDQVLRKTGGFPQLIDGTEIQAPAAGGGSWSIGQLDAEGLRVLEETIHARPEAARTVLCAAALHATDGFIEPAVMARLTGLDQDTVERLLDRERRDGSILAPQVTGYRFRHDNWIDALIGTCPAAEQRKLHERCLELLRDDPAADPRQLARHARGAGAALVGERELTVLLREAADLALTDYAFGVAAELYEQAARYAAGTDRIDLEIKQADSLRFAGRWPQARRVLKRAVEYARTHDMPGREALALIHLERLTWSFGLNERELTQQIRDVLARLPAGETVLRAQARAALTTRLSISARKYEGEQADLARAALEELPSVTDGLAQADITLGIRAGLQDIEPPEKLLEFGASVADLALSFRSAFHLEEVLSSRVVDLIRAGRLFELPAAVRAYHEFADQSATNVAVYTTALIDAMLALARGDFAEAKAHTDEAGRLSEHWGESMAREALMGQAGWLLYEKGETDGLTGLLADFVQQSVSSLNESLWALAAALVHAERGETGPAIAIFRDVCLHTGNFSELPRGASRIGVLAVAAMVLGHAALTDAFPAGEAARLGMALAGLLTAHQDTMVIAGWPSVILGSKRRFIGLAYLAAGQLAEAVGQLVLAADENSGYAALEIRTRFDLARALIRQPDSYAQGLAELGRVGERAGERGMAGLAAQAAAIHPTG